MAFTNHTFCWHGLVSTDVARTTRFFGDVLPWTVATRPMGDEHTTFFLASDGDARAHTRPPQAPGQATHWLSYLRVDDVDAAVAAATAAGGTVLVPPTDIPPGRFSTVASPTGAAFQLFHEADPAEVTDPADVDGAVAWVELHSTDLPTDLAWLEAAFGITTQIMPMPDGPYHLLMSGETSVGGATSQQHPGAPSMWLPWVRTDAIDDVAAAVPAAGGHLLAPPFDVPGVGRLAILSDPTGGVLGFMRPAPRDA